MKIRQFSSPGGCTKETYYNVRTSIESEVIWVYVTRIISLGNYVEEREVDYM